MNPKTETPMPGSLVRIARLCNAITEALREIDKCPDDSVQDIWNESMESWETGFRMDHHLIVKPNDPSSPPLPRG
jgi:hypothetical protein